VRRRGQNRRFAEFAVLRPLGSMGAEHGRRKKKLKGRRRSARRRTRKEGSPGALELYPQEGKRRNREKWGRSIGRSWPEARRP